MIDLLFICLSFVLLRSFAAFCDLAWSFCDIFAMLCDFLWSSAIFCGLLRLLRSSANFRYRSKFLLRSSANFFNLLRSSAGFCGLLRSSVVFFNWFDVSFRSLPQSSEIAILSENVILSAMTIANTNQPIDRQLNDR